MSAAALSTAGGLVFGGTADRRFFALDADTGDLLWETRLNGDVSGAPVTFEVDGRQYLAVGAGGRIANTTLLCAADRHADPRRQRGHVGLRVALSSFQVPCFVRDRCHGVDES